MLFHGKVKKKSKMLHFVDATEMLKFSDAISKALAIYALSARRITKLLRILRLLVLVESHLVILFKNTDSTYKLNNKQLHNN